MSPPPVDSPDITGTPLDVGQEELIYDGRNTVG